MASPLLPRPGKLDASSSQDFAFQPDGTLRCPANQSLTLSSSQYHLLREWVNERLSQAQMYAKIEPKDQGKAPLTMAIFCTIVSYKSN
jgi:hypothetical protein